MKVTIEQSEMNELVRLQQEAQKAPAFGFSSQQVLSGNDFSAQAWDRLREYMDKLGAKYGYLPETAIINPNSLSFEANSAEPDC